MALTLVTTLSSDTANSYVDVAYCDDYWLNHYSSTKADLWAALTNSQKIGLLVQACRSIEALRFTVQLLNRNTFEFRPAVSHNLVVQYNTNTTPVKESYTQSLQFPRNLDRDNLGVLFIPEPVKLAQCEQAVYLLSFDESSLSSKLQGVATEKVIVGNIAVSQTFSGHGSTISPMALEFLSPFLIRTSSVIRRG